MNKEENITFRASKEEKELIKQKADDANMKMSDFIRSCCLSGTKYKTVKTTNTTIEIIEINE